MSYPQSCEWTEPSVSLQSLKPLENRAVETEIDHSPLADDSFIFHAGRNSCHPDPAPDRYYRGASTGLGMYDQLRLFTTSSEIDS